MGFASGYGGIDFAAQYSVSEFTPGWVVDDLDGGSWMFIKCGHALTAYMPYKILGAGVVGSATAADDALDDNAASFVGGFGVCWPQAAFVADTYGWVRLSGTFESFCVTGVSAGDRLYSSATVGVLGGTRSGHYDIVGPVVAVDANSTGSDGQITIKVAHREPFVSSAALA